MNRITSVLAGTVATAVTGFGVIGVAATQGMFAASPVPAAANEAAAESGAAQGTAWTAEKASPTAGAGVRTVQQVVYVDKTPIVVNKEIRIPAAASEADDSAAVEGGTASPTAAPPAAPTRTLTPRPTATPAAILPASTPVPTAAVPAVAQPTAAPAHEGDTEAPHPEEQDSDGPEQEEPETEHE